MMNGTIASYSNTATLNQVSQEMKGRATTNRIASIQKWHRFICMLALFMINDTTYHVSCASWLRILTNIYFIAASKPTSTSG